MTSQMWVVPPKTECSTQLYGFQNKAADIDLSVSTGLLTVPCFDSAVSNSHSARARLFRSEWARSCFWKVREDEGSGVWITLNSINWKCKQRLSSVFLGTEYSFWTIEEVGEDHLLLPQRFSVFELWRKSTPSFDWIGRELRSQQWWKKYPNLW